MKKNIDMFTLHAHHENNIKQFGFPYRLHKMLSDAEEEGNEHILAWMSNGNSFRINNRVRFETEILPKYSHRPIQMRSFLRQLNLYGFKRVENVKSKDFGAYSHKLFVRDDPSLCTSMTRKYNNTNNHAVHVSPQAKGGERGFTVLSEARKSNIPAENPLAPNHHGKRQDRGVQEPSNKEGHWRPSPFSPVEALWAVSDDDSECSNRGNGNLGANQDSSFFETRTNSTPCCGHAAEKTNRHSQLYYGRIFAMLLPGAVGRDNMSNDDTTTTNYNIVDMTPVLRNDSASIRVLEDDNVFVAHHDPSPREQQRRLHIQQQQEQYQQLQPCHRRIADRLLRELEPTPIMFGRDQHRTKHSNIKEDWIGSSNKQGDDGMLEPWLWFQEYWMEHGASS